jgi:hypothetical protein
LVDNIIQWYTIHTHSQYFLHNIILTTMQQSTYTTQAMPEGYILLPKPLIDSYAEDLQGETKTFEISFKSPGLESITGPSVRKPAQLSIYFIEQPLLG